MTKTLTQTLGLSATSSWCMAPGKPLELFMPELDRFLSEHLPAINLAIDTGRLSLDQLNQAWWPLEEKLFGLLPVIATLNRDAARELLRRIAFVPSSLEHHTQGCGLPAGAGISTIRRTEQALIALSAVAQHIPRDSHSTYWLWNTGPTRFRFTTDAQEDMFADAVVATHELETKASDAIRLIASGNVPLRAPETADVLMGAAGDMAQLCETYIGLRPPKFTPHFFATCLRTYLPTYPVAGTTWAGVNAANLAAQISLDYLTGFCGIDYYTNVVRNRMLYMVPEDQEQVDRDVQSPGLLAMIASHFGYREDGFVLLGPVGLAARLIVEPADVQTAFHSAAEFLHQSRRLTGIHGGLIRSHLINFAKTLTPEERKHLAVDPDHGTGRHSHAETFAIMEMRTKNVAASQIIAASRLLGAEKGGRA